MALFRKERVLYYPGCVTQFKLKRQFGLYKKILNKLKIDYFVLDDFLCCGNKLFDLGYETEVRKLARRNLKTFKQRRFSKVITNCPECYKLFSQNYGEMLPDWDIEAEPIIISIFREMIKKKIKSEITKEKIIYHDNCYLGRYCRIYDEPRQVLELLGYELVELKNKRESALCCGVCGGLGLTNPELAEKTAENLIKKIKEKGVGKVVTASPDCYLHLKNKAKDSGIEVLEMSEIIAEGLGIEYGE